MRPLFLIGYMGCGKTTLGRAVAQRVSMPLIDLDDYIEQRAGRTVSEIFATEGEAAFRALEREALAEVSAMSDVIVACGGGTPCQPGLMDAMLAAGTTVWLEAPIPVLARRLAEGKAQRPLIASLDDADLPPFIAEALGKRAPHYRRAAARFDSSRLETADEIAASAEKFINQFIRDI